jgi:heterodisulfide reductase subunit A
MGKHIVVIGGGVAGMEAAGQLSKCGFEVSLLEKESKTGGHLNDWYKLFPDRRNSSDVKEYLDGITGNDRITLLTGTTIEKFNKNRNNFLIVTNKG